MRFWFFLLPLAIAASCGGMIDSSDAGNDAAPTGASCSVDSDCTIGLVCAYPVKDGCSATQHCLAPPKLGACKAMPYCACDGTTVEVCSEGAPKPVVSPGICTLVEGGSCVSPVSCEVCDVTGFAPLPLAEPWNGTHVCSSADISAFVTACLGASATKCLAWETSDAGAGCRDCIITTSASATTGPFVCDQTVCTANTGGCMDLVGDEIALEQSTGGAGSCGDLVSAADQCASFACGGCVATSDYEGCDQDARSNACKSYEDAVASSSICAIDGGTTACSPQSDADWTAFISLFCGTGP